MTDLFSSLLLDSLTCASCGHIEKVPDVGLPDVPGLEALFSELTNEACKIGKNIEGTSLLRGRHSKVTT